MKTIKIISSGLIMLLFIAGCEKEEIIPQTNARTGIIAIKLTDSPAKYAALDVEITGIEIYSPQSDWIKLNNETRIISILKLTNGANVSLTRQQSIKVGHYTKIKIIFGDLNKLGLNNNPDFAVSGAKMIDLNFRGNKEILIDIDVEIKPLAYSEILLDFEAAQSIIEMRSIFFLDPVISVITNPRTGVMGDLEAPSYLGVTGAIFAINGRDTVTSYTNAEGKFLLRGMREGVYEIIILPALFNPQVIYPQNHYIHGVIVSEGQITNLGKINVGTGIPN